MKDLWKILALVIGILLGAATPAKSQIRDCGREMEQDHKQFLRQLRTQNFHSNASTDKAANDQLVAWLRARNKYVITHEKAHQKAAGKWRGEIVYLTYQWYGIKYATAGCHKPKRGIPLNRIIKSALAPEKPSSQDRDVVKRARTYVKFKTSRANCRKLKGRAKQAKCLKKFRAYKWLDSYPVK